MNNVLIAPAALGDLEEIWDYYAIELQNPDAADRIRDGSCKVRLLRNRVTVAWAVKGWEEKSAKIFMKIAFAIFIPFYLSMTYKEFKRMFLKAMVKTRNGKTPPIEVVRVLHGARDVQAILGGESAGDEPNA